MADKTDSYYCNKLRPSLSAPYMLPCVILSYTVFKGASRLNNIILTNLCYLNNFLAVDGLLAVLILTKFTNKNLNFRLVHRAATSGIVCLIVYTVNDVVEQGFLTFFLSFIWKNFFAAHLYSKY